MIEKKFTKNFTVNDLSFNLAITRSMAIKAIKSYPSYWDSLMKSNTIKQLVADVQKNKKSAKDVEKELLNSYGKDLDVKKSIELIELSNDMEIGSEIIVNYILPEMLEFGENKLPIGVKDYKEYAINIIAYLEDINVLYDYVFEDVPYLGFYTLVMTFITQAFTKGGVSKESAFKIQMN